MGCWTRHSLAVQQSVSVHSWVRFPVYLFCNNSNLYVLQNTVPVVIPMASTVSMRAFIGACLKRENHLLKSILYNKHVETRTPSREVHFGKFRQQLNSPLTDPENKGKRQDGTNFDTLGSWNNRMAMPVNMEQSIKKGKLIPKMDITNIGEASLLGRRKVNEDRFFFKELSPDLSLYGIFDGHGGHIAAEYVQNHLTDHITQCVDSGETELTVILEKAFVEVNKAFTKYLHTNFVGTYIIS